MWRATASAHRSSSASGSRSSRTACTSVPKAAPPGREGSPARKIGERGREHRPSATPCRCPTRRPAPTTPPPRPLLRSATDGASPGGSFARKQTHALTAAIKGTRGPRVIQLSGLARTNVCRRRRTTPAFSSARAAIKIAVDHTWCISGAPIRGDESVNVTPDAQEHEQQGQQ